MSTEKERWAMKALQCSILADTEETNADMRSKVMAYIEELKAAIKDTEKRAEEAEVKLAEGVEVLALFSEEFECRCSSIQDQASICVRCRALEVLKNLPARAQAAAEVLEKIDVLAKDFKGIHDLASSMLIIFGSKVLLAWKDYQDKIGGEKTT